MTNTKFNADRLDKRKRCYKGEVFNTIQEEWYEIVII